MRSLAVLVGCAALVVLAALFWDPGLGSASGSLSLSVRRSRPGEGEAPITGKIAKPPGLPIAPSRRSLAKAPAAPIDDRLHGIVGEGMLELEQATLRLSPAEILRSQRKAITRAIAKIREHLRPEDVDYLVAKFQSMEDPGFRYAMLWLFRAVHDDRVVAPVASLAGAHPALVSDTLAAIGTPYALRTLADESSKMKGVRERMHAYERIGRSSWRGAEGFLKGVWSSPEADPEERLAALAALGQSPGQRARETALRVALGPSLPFPKLGSRAARFGGADLRAGGVLAVMQGGEESQAIKLFEHGDDHPGDHAFAAMLDRNLMAFPGAGLVDFLLTRAVRRGQIRFGEAVYLARHTRPGEAERLSRLMGLAEDDRTARALESAVQRASMKPHRR